MISRSFAVAIAAVALSVCISVDKANAQWGAYQTWHGDYYHVAWGQPVALVVPPTVRWQSHYNWGVANTRVTPVYHQFGPYRGEGVIGRRFFAPPAWPSSTDQLGVYPVRAPW